MKCYICKSSTTPSPGETINVFDKHHNVMHQSCYAAYREMHERMVAVWECHYMHRYTPRHVKKALARLALANTRDLAQAALLNINHLDPSPHEK